MADGVNWEFNAPRFIDFTADIDNQHPGDSYFEFDHENGGIPLLRQSHEDNRSARTSTPEILKPRRVTRDANGLSGGALQPLRLPRRSRVADDLKAPLASEEQGKLTPDVSAICEIADAENHDPSRLEQRTSTPETICDAGAERTLRSAVQRIKVEAGSSRRLRGESPTASPRPFSTPNARKQASKRKVSTQLGVVPAKRMKPHATVPVTPSFMKEHRLKQSAIARDLTAEREANDKRRADGVRKRAGQLYAQRARTRLNASSVTQGSSANSTQTTFLGAATPRNKTHRMQTRREATIDDFVKTLRSHATPLKRQLTTTIPVTPKFASRGRMRALPVSSEELQLEETKKKFRAAGVIHAGIPFIPKLTQKFTVVEPFPVDKRSQQMLARKESKIRNIVNNEKLAREFVANPMPCEPDMLPEKHTVLPTQPEPFRLHTEERGAVRQEKWNEQLEKVRKEEADGKKFKATRVLRSKFVPQPSTKMPTEFVEFDFEMPRRSEEWQALETTRRQLDVENQQLIERNEIERRAKEAEQLTRLRKETEFKANPIARYKGVQVRRSERPVTEPHTPKFSNRFKK